MRQADMVANLIPPYKAFLEKKIAQYEAEQRRLEGRQRIKDRFVPSEKDDEGDTDLQPATGVEGWVDPSDI